jgi:hypothetical protein
MAQETMKVIDDSYLLEEGDEAGQLNPDLIPVDISGFDDTEEYSDTNGLTIKQVRVEEEPLVAKPTETPIEEDILTLLLKSKGITNPSEILFEEDDGTQTTRDFNSLSKEEQLELLESNDADINYGLEDNEVEAINLLRENNMTLEELIAYHKAQAIEEYQNSQNTTFEIDNYTDEELYVLDLKTKF